MSETRSQTKANNVRYFCWWPAACGCTKIRPFPALFEYLVGVPQHDIDGRDHQDRQQGRRSEAEQK
jgi:hypothetical protein